MSASKAVRAKLISVPAINDPTGGRIYPRRVPQGVTAYPRIIYGVEDEDRDSTYSGESGFAKAMINLVGMCDSYAQADALSRALKDALNDADGEWGGVTIHGCYLEGDDQNEGPEPETKRTIYFIEQKYLLLFETDGGA